MIKTFYIFILITISILGFGADPPEMFQIKAKMYESDYIGAIGILKSIDNNTRDDYNIKLLLAECSWKLKDYNSAFKYYSEAEKNRPNIAAYELARCYAISNDTSNVYLYLQHHLESRYKKPYKTVYLEPTFSKFENTKKWNQFWENKWYNNKEILTSEVEYYLKYKNYNEALNHLKSNLKKRSITHELLYLKSKAYEGIMNYADALKNINKAISIRKTVPEYYQHRANLYIKLEKYTKALEDVSIALDIDPYWFDGYIKKAELEKELKEYEHASETINFYLKYFAENIEVHFLSGEIYFEKGEYLKALEKFNFCLKNDVSKAKYFNARGKTYLKTSMYIYAIKDFSMALDIEPSGETYYNRALARKQSGNTEFVCSDLKKAYVQGVKEAYTLILDWCE